MPTQVPNRLTDPQASPQTQAIHTDIYDKLNRLLTSTSSPAPAPTPTPTPTPVPVIPSGGGGGGGGGGGVSGFANVPLLPAVPSNNPTVGAPYAVDGTLIEVNKQFWRYAGDPTYQWQQAGSATELLTDTHANRVLNFPASTYPGALFLETDTLLLLESNGVSWVSILQSVQDTHANRLSTWPSVQYSAGTKFYETDRTVTYVTEDAAGTVTVAGGVNVTWTAGNHFINTGTGFNAAQWPAGTPITIGGVDSTVSVVGSSTTLTLATAVANGAGQTYTVASGRWVFLEGVFSSALASLPTDLGENDTTLVSTKAAIGFKFFENDTYFHQLQWNVSAWQRGPDDPEHSDTFHEFGAAPTDGGWAACDGTSKTYLKYDGTTASRTLPNTDATTAYARGGNAYSPTITAAVDPTLGGQTDDTTIGFTPAAAATSVGVGVTAGGVTVNSLTSGGGGGSLNTDPHNHTLSAATVSLAGGDPVAHFEIVRMYRR